MILAKERNGEVFQRGESRSHNQKGSQAESKDSNPEGRTVEIQLRSPGDLLRGPALKHQAQQAGSLKAGTSD